MATSLATGRAGLTLPRRSPGFRRANHLHGPTPSPRLLDRPEPARPQSLGVRFVGTDPTGRHLATSPWRAAAGLATVDEVHGWSRPVFVPVDGEVVVAHDGERDRQRLVPVADLLASFLFRPLRHRANPIALAGNHAVIASDRGAAFLAHFRAGSLQVSVGDQITAGQPIAEIGNSGNTVLPHVHFHMLDAPDLSAGRPIPFAIRHWQHWDGERWINRDGTELPTKRIRLRHLGPAETT